MKISKIASLCIAGSAAFIIGCGGGGSSSSSSSAQVSGTVEASKLAGVKVCVKNTTNCVTTDSNGKFTINAAAPVDLELKIGDQVLGDITANSNTMTITPRVLADGNVTLASYIGATLHMMAGCDMTAQTCDFSGVSSVDIEDGNGTTLIDKIKTACLDGKVQINVNGTLKEVNSTIVSMYESANPDMVSASVTYSGAANAGDFATFTFDPETNTLNYHVTGPVFGDKNGTLQMQNVYENVFYKDQYNNFYFFSQSMGVAMITFDDGTTTFVTGLQTPYTLDTSLITNKTFNIVSIDTNGIGFDVIEINGSNDTNGTWRSVVSDDNGTWVKDGKHLVANDSAGSFIGNIIIRPPVVEGGRAGIIVDENGGFALGVEAKPLEADEINGRYYYYDEGGDYMCYGYVDVNGTSYTFKDTYCSDGEPEEGSGALVLNPSIDPDQNASTDNNITLNGFARLKDENGTLTKTFVYIDPTAGYYVSVDMESGEINIGSNKPLK